MRVVRTIVLVIIIGLIPLHALAEPSKPIAELMDTPASAFDIFLFHIKVRGEDECYHTYWADPINQSDLCLTDLAYSYDDNIIEMRFFVSRRHKLLQGLSGKLQKEKEDTIKKILTEAAEIAGVEKKGVIGYLGWIQLVPIRHGWGAKNLNESEIREEIRRRTRVVLYTDVIDWKRYKAVRSHHGEITIGPEN